MDALDRTFVRRSCRFERNELTWHAPCCARDAEGKNEALKSAKKYEKNVNYFSKTYCIFQNSMVYYSVRAMSTVYHGWSAACSHEHPILQGGPSK